MKPSGLTFQGASVSWLLSAFHITTLHCALTQPLIKIKARPMHWQNSTDLRRQDLLVELAALFVPHELFGNPFKYIVPGWLIQIICLVPYGAQSDRCAIVPKKHSVTQHSHAGFRAGSRWLRWLPANRSGYVLWQLTVLARTPRLSAAVRASGETRCVSKAAKKCIERIRSNDEEACGKKHATFQREVTQSNSQRREVLNVHGQFFVVSLPHMDNKWSGCEGDLLNQRPQRANALANINRKTSRYEVRVVSFSRCYC